MSISHRRFFNFAFLLRCVPALLLLLLGIWCSSGTLATYALTLQGAQVSDPCRYLLNIDHGHFLGPYRLLEGLPRTTWEWSVYLRRILYPLFAYPFMRQWGFEIGGFISNLTLYIITFLTFLSYVRWRFTEHAAYAAGWILATYPGIAYWAGLPYCHVAIVPMSLLAGVCVIEIDHSKTIARILVLSLVMGIAFTAYDLLPFFAPAALLLLLLAKRWKALPVAALAMILPNIVMSAWLKNIYQVDLINSNTVTYQSIISAYLSPPAFSAWWPLIADVPKVALHNFFFSNFLFLPVLFIGVLGWKLLASRSLPSVSRPELAMFASAVLVFLFANLAPPYPGWQLRGVWIARLFQPIFVPMLFYVVRWYSRLEGRRAVNAGKCLIGATVALNAAVVFGPITNWTLAEPIYYNFYRHSPPTAMTENIEKYGQRPLGFCAKAATPKVKR